MFFVWEDLVFEIKCKINENGYRILLLYCVYVNVYNVF